MCNVFRGLAIDRKASSQAVRASYTYVRGPRLGGEGLLKRFGVNGFTVYGGSHMNMGACCFASSRTYLVCVAC